MGTCFKIAGKTGFCCLTLTSTAQVHLDLGYFECLKHKISLCKKNMKKICIPPEMSSDSFLLQGSLCKMQFCVTFYEIVTHYPKSKLNLDLRIRVVEA